MSTASAPVSDLLITVKSREIQRALLAEMRHDGEAARRHFLASAHLELVIASDYEQAGDADLALRSSLSAASCFWRAGEQQQAVRLFDDLRAGHPMQAAAIQQVQEELAADYPSGR